MACDCRCGTPCIKLLSIHIMMTLDIAINFSCLRAIKVKCLRNSIKKFYGRYPDLIGKYQRSVKDMVADSFPD